MLNLRVACSALAVLGLLAGSAAAAEKPSQDQIIKALMPKKPLTRSLSMSPPADNPQAAAERQFIESLRNRATRSLSTDEREKIVAIAKDQPSIDLEINFNFNSATVSPAAMPDVDKLGKALSDPALKGGTFVLSGHTDAVGSDGANLDLSNRRADAVKRLLVEKYGIPAENLVTVGHGEKELKNKENPNAAENRRVQVINMVDKVAAK